MYRGWTHIMRTHLTNKMCDKMLFWEYKNLYSDDCYKKPTNVYLLSIKYNVATEKNAAARHVLIIIGGKTSRHYLWEKAQRKEKIHFILYIFCIV